MGEVFNMNKTVVIVGSIALAGIITVIVLSKRGAQAGEDKGYIVVNTTPPGAAISINGTYAGTSPHTFAVTPGSYSILLQLAGYFDISTSVTVGAGETKTCDPTFVPVSDGGWIPVDVNWT
jgi:hypothetical protein